MKQKYPLPDTIKRAGLANLFTENNLTRLPEMTLPETAIPSVASTNQQDRFLELTEDFGDRRDTIMLRALETSRKHSTGPHTVRIEASCSSPG